MRLQSAVDAALQQPLKNSVTYKTTILCNAANHLSRVPEKASRTHQHDPCYHVYLLSTHIVGSFVPICIMNFLRALLQHAFPAELSERR